MKIFKNHYELKKINHWACANKYHLLQKFLHAHK